MATTYMSLWISILLSCPEASNYHALLYALLNPNTSFAILPQWKNPNHLTLPYLTLPYGEDVLPPSAEASNGPNAHP